MDRLNHGIPHSVLQFVPESVAREHIIIPLYEDGEKLIIASTNADDLALSDKLGFLIAKAVQLEEFSESQILSAINREYGVNERDWVDSYLYEAGDDDFDEVMDCELSVDGLVKSETREVLEQPGRIPATSATIWGKEQLRRAHDSGLQDYQEGQVSSYSGSEFKKGKADSHQRGQGMWFYVVEEGDQVLVRHTDGQLEIVKGPKRIFRGRKSFQPMRQYVAHPGQYLVVRFRNGEQKHLPGPIDLWEDPRIHQQITVQQALHLAAKEAVVVYHEPEEGAELTRRIVEGPTMFVPKPGEWLHQFSWHGAKGGSQGAEKIANALVFEKLWLMPDQMYHDVKEVRTSDDAVLTIKLMIFYELLDIERMLDTTHDPIGDFINAASSDVIEFTGKHDFERFKQNTDQLNELKVYKQLTNRAEQCGYRINKVVYRGYGAPDSLQQMHNQAIEARTRLQLEKANEQQSQDLEDYKLTCQMQRAEKRREEQTSEIEHELEMTKKKQKAELNQQQEREATLRDLKRERASLEVQLQYERDQLQQQHLKELRDMNVDLTSYLTQNRADRVIELRGGNQPHLHLDESTNTTKPE